MKPTALGAFIGFVATGAWRLAGSGINFGQVTYDRASLEQARDAGKRIQDTVIGMATIAEDVPPELAAETIDHLTVMGLLLLPRATHQAIEGRVTVMGTVDALVRGRPECGVPSVMPR